MKKLLFIAAATLVSLTSFATPKPGADVHVKAVKHFEVNFKHANAIEWKTTKEFTKATFLLDGEKCNAFYDAEGNALGMSKAVSSRTLPKNAMKTIEKKYKDYAMIEAIEFQNDSERCYYVSMDNEKKTDVLKVTFDGSVSVFKSTKK